VHTPVREFRHDINGLRAWAVAGVVLYHLGIPGFKGGFVGVDVFFVISGFLMTGLIVGGLERGGFSLRSFYMARARRIVPALLALCAALLAVGWLFLPPQEYAQLGRHAVSAATFLSNHLFAREAGYFDAASHEKWLLHTWSLSVEWQFYIALPLALVAIWRLAPGRRSIALALGAVLVLSLAASITLTPRNAPAAFFLLPTRAWEMLAGGLVFLLMPRLRLTGGQSAVLEGAGFALIIGSVVVMSAGQGWPGWRAAIPVAGAALVLIANRQHSILTRGAAVQWLGNASYSVYLWHWPVVVGLAYAGLLDSGWAAAGVVASLVLGHASWKFVEQPGRRMLASVPPCRGAAVVVAAVVAVGVPALVVNAGKGWPGRLDPAVERTFAEAVNWNPRMGACLASAPRDVVSCTYGGPDLGVIVMGDSHAATIVRALERSLPADRHVLDWTYGACPPLVGVRSIDPMHGNHCGRIVPQLLTRQRALDPAAPVIVMSRWTAYIDGPNEHSRRAEFGQPSIYFDGSAQLHDQVRQRLAQTVCALAETRPVYLMRPTPELREHVPKTMGRAMQIVKPVRVSITLDEYRQRHRFILEAQDAAAKQCGAKILDPVPLLCEGGQCWGDKGGVPLYFDDNHLSETGAALLAPLFAEVAGHAAGTPGRP
jgi:peptidoglycan/LPS O-acetylase OafA/YrhL